MKLPRNLLQCRTATYRISVRVGGQRNHTNSVLRGLKKKKKKYLHHNSYPSVSGRQVESETIPKTFSWRSAACTDNKHTFGNRIKMSRRHFLIREPSPVGRLRFPSWQDYTLGCYIRSFRSPVFLPNCGSARI